jgi:hypothetical protein
MGKPLTIELISGLAVAADSLISPLFDVLSVFIYPSSFLIHSSLAEARSFQRKYLHFLPFNPASPETVSMELKTYGDESCSLERVSLSKKPDYIAMGGGHPPLFPETQASPCFFRGVRTLVHFAPSREERVSRVA